MKSKKYHSREQILKLLDEAYTRLTAGQSRTQVCLDLGIANSTLYRWRNQYGAMKGEDVNLLKELEKENAHLKRMVADLMLDRYMRLGVAKRKF